jgi:hypothetical protein
LNVQIVRLNVINDYVVDIIVQLQMKLVDRPKREENLTNNFSSSNATIEQKPHICTHINHRLKVKKNWKKEKFVLFFYSSISFMPSAFGQVCRIVFHNTYAYNTQVNCCNI